MDAVDRRARIVQLSPQGWQFEATPGENLAAAARAAGIVMRTSCRNGTCRACLGRLLEGRIDYAIEWPGLSADEKREGYVLPCVARACSDLVIEVPHLQRA